MYKYGLFLSDVSQPFPVTVPVQQSTLTSQQSPLTTPAINSVDTISQGSSLNTIENYVSPYTVTVQSHISQADDQFVATKESMVYPAG